MQRVENHFILIFDFIREIPVLTSGNNLIEECLKINYKISEI
jgi:hypothetical protein